jgi:tRNA(Ile)-lysidine synthase
MNFFRGTGLEGLSGMKERTPDGVCLRPLLTEKRTAVLDYAEEHKLAWVEDSSNQSSKYTRNFFRNELIPAITRVYPQVEDNLLHNIGRWQQTNQLYQQLLGELKSKLVEKTKDGCRLPVKKLTAYNNPSLIYELVKPYGFGESRLPDIMNLLKASTGKYVANEQYQIIRHRNWLVIAPKTENAELITIAADETEVGYRQGTLQFKTVDRNNWTLDKSPVKAQLDNRHIEYPLLLRPWKAGDYFYPLGMHKKKKLARFLIDQKIARHQKEDTWVLISGNRIIWVAGHRIDDRFKITDQTQSVLEITLHRK